MRKMIVCDSTTLITLINIDEFEILKIFIDNLFITKEVYDEVTKVYSSKKILDFEINSGFISIKEFNDKKFFDQLCYILDKGESSSIILALEQKLPLIIDEKKGREFAKKQGVEIIGLIGIVRFLYHQKMIKKDKVLNIIHKLNSSDFRITPKLLSLILMK